MITDELEEQEMHFGPSIGEEWYEAIIENTSLDIPVEKTKDVKIATLLFYRPSA